MRRRQIVESLSVAVLGMMGGQPVHVARGGFGVLNAVLDPTLQERAEALVRRMEALLPEGVEVSEAERAMAETLAQGHVQAVRDLVSCGDDPERAAGLAMDRGASLLRHFGDAERSKVRTLLTVYLGALRDDPEIVRDVRTQLQTLTLETVRELSAQVTELRDVIEGWDARYVLYMPTVDLGRIRDDNDLGPSQLLNATYEVVPFRGREQELDQLRQFRERTFEPDDVGTVVVAGEGGLGKTRLAMEAVREARADGWRAGFLALDATPETVRRGLRALDTAGRPVFVVADYGEDRPEQVATLIDAWLTAPADHARRLVLLVRQRGLLDQRLDAFVVQDAQLQAAVDYLKGARVQPLPASDLRVPVEERAGVFLAAQRAFAARLGRSVDGLPEPPDTLTRDPSDAPTPESREAIKREYGHLGLPLYLHMAALASLDGRATVRKRDLLGVVLDRNWAYVQRLLDDVPTLDRLDLTRDDLHDVLTVATLVLAARPPSDDAPPGASACLAPTLLGQEASPRARRQLAAFLTDAFGVEDPETGWVFDALRPDALGEGLVFETLERVPDLLNAVLEMDTETRRSACTVLVRSSLSLAEDPAVWLEMVFKAERLDTDLDLAFSLLLSIPDETVSLRPLAAALSTLVAGSMNDNEDPETFRASVLNIQGNRLAGVGRHGEALAVTEKAVEIRRRLADSAPDIFEPDLALSLNNLGNHLAEVGRRRDALAATQEATEIRRRLAAQAPDVHEPNFASSLSNLGNRLSDVGRRNDALTVTKEAANLYKQLAEHTPDAFESYLAGTLNNLSVCYSDVGQLDRALDVAEEATRLCKRLAERSPDAFEPYFAMALNNLGTCFADVGRRDDAFTAVEQGTNLHRQLAKRTPGAFNPRLAGSLSNLGIRLGEMGRHTDAVTVSEEAVEVWRGLANQAPDRFEPDLAASLSNLGIRLAAVGRIEDALAVESEATKIRRRLVERDPDAFEPDLAISLLNLSVGHAGAGRYDDALTTAKEAVTLYRQLAERTHSAFEPNFARSLSLLGDCLSAASRHADALAATEKAAALYRRLAERTPEAFDPDFSRCLGSLGSQQRALGALPAATVSFAEALQRITRFVEAMPDAFGDLAMTLGRNYLSVCQAAEVEPDATLLVPILQALGIEPESGSEPEG